MLAAIPAKFLDRESVAKGEGRRSVGDNWTSMSKAGWRIRLDRRRALYWFVKCAWDCLSLSCPRAG